MVPVKVYISFLTDTWRISIPKQLLINLADGDIYPRCKVELCVDVETSYFASGQRVCFFANCILLNFPHHKFIVLSYRHYIAVRIAQISTIDNFISTQKTQKSKAQNPMIISVQHSHDSHFPVLEPSPFKHMLVFMNCRF